jgi:hypothetical protein
MTLAAIAFLTAFVLARLVYSPARGKRDKAGPHNNWRSKKSTVSSSGWAENYSGCGSDGTSGGGGD